MRWNDVKSRLKLSPVARKRLGAVAIVLVIAYIAFRKRRLVGDEPAPGNFRPGHEEDAGASSFSSFSV